MKKIILAIALISALPVVAIAEQNADAPAKAAPKEHHMQNASTSAADAVAPTAVPEHVMQNSDGASKPAPKKVQEHTTRNN